MYEERTRFVEASDGQGLALTEASVADPKSSDDGPVFLLLHGFAQNRRAFTAGPLPRELLAHGARVFLGELRGHGESRAPARARWSSSTHLDVDCPALLEGVCRAAGAERVHLVGHSMGALLGCALLARDAPIASLTAAAMPLLLGAERPLIRLASLALGPLATLAPRGRRIPMHRFLGALARPLSRPEARGPLGLLQRATRLANPAAADPEAIESILANADPESSDVFEELARNAVLRHSKLAGVDLVPALRASRLPVAALVGSDDIFAPRAAVAPFEEGEHAGPRTVIEVPGVRHIDILMGHHVPETVSALWDFLARAGAFDH